MIFQLVAPFFTLLLIRVTQSQEPLVQLPNGQIRGRQDITSQNVSYYTFEKIPFAAPPIGNLRFRAPQPAENWEGVLDTLYLDTSCYNLAFVTKSSQPLNQSEDCLFLNVYTPKLPSEGDDVLLPVMVYIFGGAFIVGAANQNPPDLFANKGVLLVAMNYRVGPFGFLSAQDDVIPGNNGLKDQLMALKWVNQNIALFGGDPTKVTIFGQSAGAASCAYQMLNLESQGLFQGVILESGTFLSTGMFQRNSRRIAFGTAAVLNSTFSTSNDSSALLSFLLSVDATELNVAAQQYYAAANQVWSDFVEPGSVFAPVIEAENSEAFLTSKMYGLLKAGNLLQVPLMMGVNSEEKIGQYTDPAFLTNITQIVDQNLDYIVPVSMVIPDVENRTEMGRLIREIFTGGEPFSDHLGRAVRYASDAVLNRAMVKHGELFSQFATTYFYVFTYDGTFYHFDNPYPDCDNVGHGAELRYLFCSGASCTNSSSPEADLLARERLITLWTNFAKYQNPTPEEEEVLQNVIWPQVDIATGNFSYLDIGENLEIKDHPKGETYPGWVALYDSLGTDDFDTY